MELQLLLLLLQIFVLKASLPRQLLNQEEFTKKVANMRAAVTDRQLGGRWKLA
jgi:hypothetical protein